jgi:AcrR family transcriptional regulator
MNKMDEIKSAALHLFATKGYTATSMQEIADLVNLNKASLYFYIKGKKELYLLVIEEQFNLYMSAVQNLFSNLKDVSVEVLLYQTVKEILKHTSFEGLLFWKRTMIMAVSEIDKDIAKPLRKIIGSFDQHIINVLNDFISSKDLKVEEEKKSQFVTAFYIFMQSLLDWRLLNPDADIEKKAPILWDAFWNGSKLS